MQHLPSMPHAYLQVMEKLQSPSASLRDVGKVVGNDLAMTAKILQLVNSAFFGLGRHVSDTQEAASLIGLDALRALVLSIGIFSKYEHETVGDSTFSMSDLLDHSLAVGRLSKAIAKAEGVGKPVADDCFLAGVLHDIGILIIEQNVSESYVRVKTLTEEGADLSQAEVEVFGSTHGIIGAYLLGLWALPNSVVEAVAFHHQPMLSGCNEFSPLVAVHVANILIHQSGVSECLYTHELKDVDQEFLARVGMTDRFEAWKQLAVVEGEV